MNNLFKWGRYANGYEVSSQGDKRFSALYAKMPDGRTIEQHYQCDCKGYQPGGTDWKLGKGKPPLDKTKDLWKEYLNLWIIWANNNPKLIKELLTLLPEYDNTLTDRFAATKINQARALVTVLNSLGELNVSY